MCVKYVSFGSKGHISPTIHEYMNGRRESIGVKPRIKYARSGFNVLHIGETTIEESGHKCIRKFLMPDVFPFLYAL